MQIWKDIESYDLLTLNCRPLYDIVCIAISQPVFELRYFPTFTPNATPYTLSSQESSYNLIKINRITLTCLNLRVLHCAKSTNKSFTFIDIH